MSASTFLLIRWLHGHGAFEADYQSPISCQVICLGLGSSDYRYNTAEIPGVNGHVKARASTQLHVDYIDPYPDT